MAKNVLPGVNFLEPHNELQRLARLPEGHIIVDLEDWQKVVIFLSDSKNAGILNDVLNVEVHPQIRKVDEAD